ncbi:triose-phosphate isomerase [uncultured Mailhella sp.]|uniref:triose-phosphate isomerase n=1 Tax=uncultured Mailhella sp. TaxID=1981031 RepID=UPI0025DE2306|nr:triose-phosphate isomerase [uncultured Mailhella sp.]
MKKLMAANWKMYKTGAEAVETVQAMAGLLNGQAPEGREIVIFVPFTALERACGAMEAIKGAACGAEDVYPAAEGAFTGEISPAMIRACGASWVLTGHSERRHVIGESDSFVGEKTAFALANGLRVMLCIGETLEEREAGLLRNVLERQLKLGLKNVPADTPAEALAIAYEPVWAIGTGKTATTDDIVETHAICRSLMREVLGDKADKTPLLYGGSVKPANAGSILALDNVDGVLVGGASLKADSFTQIINA